MIKSINYVGKYMSVFNGQPAVTYVNGHSGLQGVGNVRYNTATQAFEVWDGNVWMQLSMAHAQVGLSPEAESLLDWAKEKRNEEQQISELATKHPGIKDLMEKLEVMLALVREDTK